MASTNPNTPAATPSGPKRAIDILRSAANFEPIQQTVILGDGSEFVFYVTAMTASEREKAQKQGEATNSFGIQLLINKAVDENGNRLFAQGDIAALKEDIEDEDLQGMILAVLRPRGEKGEKQPESKRD